MSELGRLGDGVRGISHPTLQRRIAGNLSLQVVYKVFHQNLRTIRAVGFGIVVRDGHRRIDRKRGEQGELFLAIRAISAS